MKIIYTIIISSFILFLAGCSSAELPEIKPLTFTGFSEIMKGDTAKLVWAFKNCQKVRIENLKRNYNSEDSIFVSPDITTIYKFLAIYEKDTLPLNWRVVVKTNDENIKTGPDNRVSDRTQPSYIESDYLNGFISQSITPGVDKIKILKVKYDKSINDTAKISIIPLDDFGNFIYGLSEIPKSNLDWHIKIECKNDIYEIKKKDFKEVKFDSLNPVDVAICLDNSAIAGEYYPVFDQIKEFAKYSTINDRIHLRSFNQNVLTNISLQTSDKFSEFIKDVRLERASGLSSIYKTLYSTISYMNSFKDRNNQFIVLIAYSTDNSSLIYDRNDVIELSAKYNMPVYVIGVGNAVDSYSLKYLSELTGGRFYAVEDITLIGKILNEISVSQKAFYEVSSYIPPEFHKLCNLVKLNVTYEGAKKSSSDSLYIRFNKERQYFKYQSVASFDYKDTVPGAQFSETIRALALILKNNQDKNVELIGNSSIEGTQEETQNIALRRAQSVRRLLIEEGVNPSQIRVRSDGANNPIYFLQETTWMQYYNRRVELRWLDPELMPFELIVQSYDSEAEALKNVESWEDKGYRVYYERFLQNNIPVYRVKIWGFRTIEDAERAKSNIEKKFPVKLTLQ